MSMHKGWLIFQELFPAVAKLRDKAIHFLQILSSCVEAADPCSYFSLFKALFAFIIGSLQQFRTLKQKVWFWVKSHLFGEGTIKLSHLLKSTILSSSPSVPWTQTSNDNNTKASDHYEHILRQIYRLTQSCPTQHLTQ